MTADRATAARLRLLRCMGAQGADAVGQQSPDGLTAGYRRCARRDPKLEWTGRSAAWLARLLWEQEVGGSNPPVPIERVRRDGRSPAGVAGRRRSRIAAWAYSRLRSWSASSSSKRLERLLADARAGSGGGLVFEGPAGIGKSSLLAAAQAAAGADLRVLSARGGELERELPFGVVRQLLEPIVAAAGDDERDALLAGAAALARPVLFAPDPEAVAEPSFSALHGLYWLTINLADARPLLLAVDDAQWADLSSLRWLIYLARRLAGVPLALLLATRPAEPGPVQALLDELLVVPEVSILQPGGLSDRAITVARGTAADRHARSGLRNRLPAGDRRQPVPADRALR